MLIVIMIAILYNTSAGDDMKSHALRYDSAMTSGTPQTRMIIPPRYPELAKREQSGLSEFR